MKIVKSHFLSAPLILRSCVPRTKWFRFETYCEDYGGVEGSEDFTKDLKKWGFNLWMANGRREFEMSDAVFTSEADAKRWLIANVDEWRFVDDKGWCCPDMELKLPESEKWYQWKI